jgi:hypothetical protein
VVEKALVCGICNARTASRVAHRSVGRVAGAILCSAHEPTKRSKHPGCSVPAPLRGGCGRASGLGRRRRGGPGLQPRPTRATTTSGCSSTRIEEGSTEPSGGGAAKSGFVSRPRALHSAVLGPCCSDPQGIGLLPSTEAARHRTHCPRRESGDAPARGTRRGSTEGMAPRRHLTAFTGRARSSHEARVRLAPVPKDPRAGTRGGALLEGCPRKRDYRSGVPRAAGNRRRGERERRRQPRAEEDSRLAGVPARRTCVAEIGSAVVAQRNPRHLPRLQAVGRYGGGRGLGRG